MNTQGLQNCIEDYYSFFNGRKTNKIFSIKDLFTKQSCFNHYIGHSFDFAEDEKANFFIELAKMNPTKRVSEFRKWLVGKYMNGNDFYPLDHNFLYQFDVKVSDIKRWEKNFKEGNADEVFDEIASFAEKCNISGLEKISYDNMYKAIDDALKGHKNASSIIKFIKSQQNNTSSLPYSVLYLNAILNGNTFDKMVNRWGGIYEECRERYFNQLAEIVGQVEGEDIQSWESTHNFLTSVKEGIGWLEGTLKTILEKYEYEKAEIPSIEGDLENLNKMIGYMEKHYNFEMKKLEKTVKEAIKNGAKKPSWLK